MKRYISNVSANRMVGEIFLPAITILFGLQILRVFIPQMVWLFGDRLGMNAVLLGIIAVAVFSFAFLSGLLIRFAGRPNLVLYTAAGIGLMRLLVQIQWSEPLVMMIFSIFGTVLFGLFLSSFTDHVRFRSGDATGHMAIGILTGFLLDTALHGAFATWDMVWQTGILPLLIVIVLIALQGFSLNSFRTIPTNEAGYSGRTWPWLAIGPFIFFQTVVLQNIARYTVMTGWDQPYVFGLILISQIAGIAAVIYTLKKPAGTPFVMPLIAGVILIICSLITNPANAWLATIIVLAGQLSISLLLSGIISGTVTEKPGASTVTGAGGTGFLLLGLITLAYYTVYQISLPYDNTIIEPITACVIALCAILPSFTRQNPVPVTISWRVPMVALLLLVLPLAGIIARFPPVPATTDGDGFPVKIMTYNLHNGFSPKGNLDLEALAVVIEKADPDILILQEISRGWLISGRVDMLDWLSQRLDMPCLTGPTEGRLWGNAVFTRLPHSEAENYELPPRDLVLRRGFMVTTIDIGNGESINVIATHLHHIPEDAAIRQEQVPVIIDYWNGIPVTVITGDMNAHADAPEMEMMRNAGFIDVMADTIPPEGYTFNSVQPFERIDYIWITPDLKAANAEVLRETASDHMPVIVELSR